MSASALGIQVLHILVSAGRSQGSNESTFGITNSGSALELGHDVYIISWISQKIQARTNQSVTSSKPKAFLTCYQASEISSTSSQSPPISYSQTSNTPRQLLTTPITMPLGFAGFPRDPSSGKPVGLAQRLLSSPSSKEGSKNTQDTTSSWKAQEAARDSCQSTDTLPVYQEKNSSSQN